MKKYEDSSEATADMDRLEQLSTELVALLKKEELKQWITATDQHYDANVGRLFVQLRVDASNLETLIQYAVESLTNLH